MARLRFGRPISLRWNGLLLEGPANTVFEIPDEFYEEFNQDIGTVEPTIVWLDTDEGSTLRGRVTDLEADKVSKTIVDAKGDLIVGTAADTVSRLAVSATNGHVLSADSTAATGLSWVAQSGGVSAVGGTGPISVSTVSGTATVSVSSASTSAAGTVQLSDATNVTSSILAATPTAVKSAYDRGSTGVTNAATAQAKADTAVQADALSYLLYQSSSVIATTPRWLLTTSSASFASGTIYWSLLAPHKNFTVTNIAFQGSSNAFSALTLCRFGIYTRSGSTFTLVARTASDTSIFSTANTKYTRALDTTGGYPATYTLTAGSEYFIAVIAVGTNMGTVLSSAARAATAAVNATGYPYYVVLTQSDLTASVDRGALNSTISAFYAEVS